MNWLIQENMFTYFYNKFRPVNRIYYMKCVASWITVLSRHTVFSKRVIYYKFTFV
jgi:hypothetical protein